MIALQKKSYAPFGSKVPPMIESKQRRGTTKRPTMTAASTQDPTTGDGAEEVAQHVKDFCDKAVANLKAGSVFRLEEACRDASEALDMDGKDAKAAALHRYALYALDPESRLLDKAEALREEAGRCAATGDCDKALELLSVAKKWHCTANILSVRAALHIKRGWWVMLVPTLPRHMCHIQQRAIINRPRRFRVEGLEVDLEDGSALVKSESLAIALMPPVPLNQLARFLNNDVQGAVTNLVFMGGGERREEQVLLRLLDEVTVPGRLHSDKLILEDFFVLPWAGIKRTLDGRTLRGDQIHFIRLQLPSGVDPNELLKLPTIRECSMLNLQLYDVHRPRLPDLPPLFNNAALVEWLKGSIGGRRQTIWLTREYLSSGLLGFLDALRKDFQQATQAHSYIVAIHCPDFDVAGGLGVRGEQLSNRLGERMAITIGESPIETEMTGHRFETVKVERLPPA